ncbi:uncharacterized protein LOC131023620 [Salvia miltiorrhiza]|uniref:uncharacterized protein LOC131023620 n=1 Tax=Salvia miltiorrhiza TaxID=226208 RepID=UPI0025AC1ACB|nr:uncharacterized protein LOC131023620 [Salvia miltiorrhiza]
MSTCELLEIEPLELQFAFELKKQISCSMQLTNKSENHVAFKVKTTNPKKYCVRPNTGVVMPHSSCDVTVTMQAQKEAPPDMQCRDKFLLQSVVVNPGVSAKDITPEMFNKDSGNQVDECKLRVAYVPPPQPPSPVREGSEEGSSPRASVSENGTVNQSSDLNVMSKGFPETNEVTSEVKALILKLTEEKQSAIQQNNRLQQELELVRRQGQGQKSAGGVPIMYVIIVSLIGILLGYLLKRPEFLTRSICRRTAAIRVEMSNCELLQIEPLELQFPFELKKQISCSMQLTNKSENHVAFKVKTTNPKKYCVRPNTGVVMPHSSCDVTVTMQAQKEAPPDMQCRDKFLLQSVVVNPGVSAKDITPEMFNKESGNQVDECKLRVAYVPPPQPPSPVREGSEEGSSPRASVSDNGTVNQASDLNVMSKGFLETNEVTSEVKALISKLTEEKQSAIQQNNRLQQELELLRRQGQRSAGGVPIMYVIIVCLIGILLGYLLKRT